MMAKRNVLDPKVRGGQRWSLGFPNLLGLNTLQGTKIFHLKDMFFPGG